jgi:hypothetical protein
MGAYQNDKQRWNFCLSIDAKEPSGMTYQDKVGSEQSQRLWLGVREPPQTGKWPIPGLQVTVEGRAKICENK